jgi:hypothetical protein
MGYVKYTKTATFLFPLLGIPKAIFSCNVKNSFGTTMFTTRFYNAFIRDCKVDNYKEGFVFVVVRAYQDVDFQCFYDTMGAFENYVDDYERGDYIVFVYSIIDKFKADYKLLMDGKYSKIKVDLLDQEVWSIITPEKEEMCDDILEDLVGESSIKPNKIHENENE